ncbi:Thiol-disulfide isomerase or thioredoxin [Hyunsoonleella jejuensis]|uniref:Thiol-disulfide isomerase or thioredoxin n=1 Tax=Hyunsoonleella jejuensis TaxID=419940 RepID=A0A1H9FR19_9FLAO|nr:TlpA disulfide reductase family protein [Hyunsoonleella jejuensis]SEQ40355.1 Thiol-disulfide isomerase or thioredoxin [Hyunsoonleella jejuensis]
MKKILIALSITLCFACNKKEEPTIDYAVISGKITNKNGVVTINSFDRTFSEPLDVAADGSFTDTLSTDKNSYVIFDGTNPVFIYVEPGYNVNVNYDAKDFENTITFSGEGAVVNSYLLAKNKNEKALLGNRYDAYLLDEADFKAKFQTIKKSSDSLLNTFENIPDDFKALEKRDLNYNYLARLSEYERYHQYVTKNQSFKASDDFLKELEGLDYLNEDDYFFSENYKVLVTSHFREEADKLAKQDSIEIDIAFLKTLSDIPNEKLKNNLLFVFANNSMSYTKDIDAFYTLYSENSTNEKNNAIIKKRYDKLAGLSKGKPSPEFVDYRNHAGGTTSLEELKGKYVYIDVWATWCGPCIKEIPSLKKVEEDYHDKNIQFVSVSIDKEKDFEKWKNMVNEKELGGIQLFADNDWSSKFVKDYEIQGIPRFILIDPEGNIVDANAPRPSNPALTDLFKALNI